VCCSVLQRVESIAGLRLQKRACSVVKRVAVCCCSVLQCVAVCCSTLQRVAVCRSVS